MTYASVSVIIPVFNGAPFVAKAVASVRRQTVQPKEIIVVDDGSTDGTKDVLQLLAKTEEIRWFIRPHEGPARTRNFGLTVATGQYIAFLDCDDIWLPQKLEVQLDIVERDGDIGVVHSNFEIINGRGEVEERVLARYSHEPLVQAFAGGHIALPSTLLIRKALLDRVGNFNSELYGSEDSDLTIRLYDQTTFACVDQVLVQKLQRGHGFRDMAFDENRHHDAVLQSRALFLQSLEQRPSLSKAQRKALNYEWANYYLRCGKIAQARGDKPRARQYYLQAMRKAPFRFRSYSRWLRSL